MRKIFVLLILTVALTGCFFDPPKKETYQIEDQIIEIDHDYSEIAAKQIQWDEIFKVELDHYFVYIYSISCNHCESLKNWVIEEGLSRDDLFLVKGSNKCVIKNDVNYTIGVGNVGDFSILGYPALVEIEDKKVVKNVAGKSQILNILN